MNNSLEKERNIYNCSKCGAIFSYQNELKHCVYCNEKINMNYKLKSNINYNYIIPFRYFQKEIINKLKQYIKRNSFFPKKFNIKNNINNIKALYIPLWIFDFETSGEVEVECSKISKFKSKSKKYEKIDLYNTTLGGNMNFSNVTLLPSKKVTEEIIDGLGNYDYSNQVEFDSKYIDDFLVEEQDIKLKDVISISEESIKQMFVDKIIKEIKDYDITTPKEKTINLRNVKKTCILIPIWLLSISYKDNVYDIFVNGQTGNVTGKIPISYKKLIFKSIVTFIFIFVLIYFLFNYKVIL